MARLFWLSDEAWALIEPHLPRGKPGKPRVDDRRVISNRARPAQSASLSFGGVDQGAGNPAAL
jgi:transposase